jgi:chromate transporter
MMDAQFLDGLGLAGVLPAPLVIFATFVSFVSGGLAGALAITAGMFLPAFSFSLLLYERLEAVVEHRRLQLFLSGAAAAVVGVILVTAFELARTTAVDSPSRAVSVMIFTTALAILYRWRSKLSPPAVLAIGAVAGIVAFS